MTSNLVGDSTARHRAARLSNRTFAAVTQLLPVGIGVVNEDGRFVSLNDPGLEIYGLDSVLDGPESLDDYNVMFPLRALDGRMLDVRERPIARALRGETVIDEEVLMHRPSDASERVLSISAELLPGRESKLVAFVVLDITQRTQATQALVQAHGLIQSITQGTGDLIAALDREFRYIFFNDAYRDEFRRLWGKDLEIGMRMTEALAPWPEQEEKSRTLWQRALDGESFSVTTDFGRPDSDHQVYDLRFNPICDADGELTGAAHILRNVTQRVEIQEALVRSEEALRENDRRKDEFLATLAHELRNPLAPVRSGIELLRGRTDDQRTLDMMERQMVQLVRLVDDLLDVSRISRGRITLNREPVNVRDVVESAREATAALYRPGNRQLVFDIPDDLPAVDADFVRAVQMVSNLLSNAMKFTGDNGTIRFSAKQESDRVCLKVQDDGVGIEPDKLGRVFELFNQADAVQGSGLGIGLTLVRNLAELHGGYVAADSAGPGQGSEFAIYLPVAQAAAERHPSVHRVRNEARLAGRRILVVDDNRDAVRALSMLLETLGATTVCAHDGESALREYATFEPHVVLLDIGLPDMSGHDVARRIRASRHGGGTRIIAVTGWNRGDPARRDGGDGFDHHLVKPVRMDDLLELVTERASHEN